MFLFGGVRPVTVNIGQLRRKRSTCNRRSRDKYDLVHGFLHPPPKSLSVRPPNTTKSTRVSNLAATFPFPNKRTTRT